MGGYRGIPPIYYTFGVFYSKSLIVKEKTVVLISLQNISQSV